MNRIPKSQAALLPNKTAPIPGDDGYYIITLDVFHQLHCLVSIHLNGVYNLKGKFGDLNFFLHLEHDSQSAVSELLSPHAHGS